MSNYSFESIKFIETPSADAPEAINSKYGVSTTASPAIKNAPLPAEGASSKSFSNLLLLGLLTGIPFYVTRKLRGGFKTFLVLAILFAIPILMAFWTLASTYSPRLNEKCKLPGKPIEHYVTFHEESLKEKYHGRKIPMETFHELYFANKASFNCDALEALEYRHDWAQFLSLIHI